MGNNCCDRIVTVIAAVDLQPWFDKDKVRKANFEVPNDTITD